MKGKKDIQELRWVRLFTASHIPLYLIEQIYKKEYNEEDLYKYLDKNCLIPTPDGPTLNPFFHLWSLVDPQNLVKGFLWFTVDPLTKDIVIQIYSVERNYWGTKGAIEKLSDHLKEIRQKAQLNKIYWITKCPKHSYKYGFKQSKSVLMEYSEKDDGFDINGRSEPEGECGSSSTSTEGLSEQCDGAECAVSGTSI